MRKARIVFCVLKLTVTPDKSKNPASVSSRDKALAQIGITYGVLRRLKFSEEMVVRCLKEIPGVDLEQAFDWVRGALFYPSGY